MKFIAVLNNIDSEQSNNVTQNLALLLGSEGKKVLIIDMDLKSISSSFFDIKKESIKYNSFNVFVEQNIDINEAIIDTNSKNVSIIPGSINFAGLETLTKKDKMKEFFLDKSLISLKNDFDFVFFDCSFSSNLINKNIFSIVDSILFILQNQHFELEFLTKMLSTVSIIKRNINSNLSIEGFLINSNSNLIENDKNEKQIIQLFDKKVYLTKILSNPNSDKNLNYKNSIFINNPNSIETKRFIQFKEEFLIKQD